VSGTEELHQYGVTYVPTNLLERYLNEYAAQGWKLFQAEAERSATGNLTQHGRTRLILYRTRR
jgi:hypothetical protein